MKHRLTIPLLACYLVLLCTAFQCGEDIEPDYQYVFQESLGLQPEHKSYRVGDTIWVQYRNRTNTLVDRRTSQPVQVDKVALPLQLSLVPRYNVRLTSVGGYCDFVTDQGLNVGRVHSSLNTTFYQELGCSGPPGYDLTVGVVLQQPGTFSLEVANSVEVRACLNRATAFPLSSLEFSFAITDGNQDVLAAIPPAQRAAIPFERLEELLASKKLFMVKVE